MSLEGVPGFVPRVLRDPGVGLFRADERVFDAMLDGWRAQMLVRRLSDASKLWLGRVLPTHFGDVPSQICFEWNSPRHTTDDAVPPGRRAFTKADVQTQVGHSYASTTGLYTSVSADFKQKTLQQMIARRTAKPEEVNTDA